MAETGLLRIAGTPIDVWLAAANPRLMSTVARLNRADAHYGTLAVEAADRLGRELVPASGLTRDDRRWILGLRRRLHRAAGVDPDEIRRARRIATQHAPALAEDLKRLATAARTVADLAEEARRLADGEPSRLARMVRDAVLASPMLSTLLAHRDPAAHARLCGGLQPRQNLAKYAWRVIDRAAVRSTPRDWHGHVALLPIEPAPPARIRVKNTVATAWSANLHARRIALGETFDGHVRVGLTPLHWVDDGRLCCLVVDREDATRVDEVQLRLTSLLAEVQAALAAGGAELAVLEDRVRSRAEREGAPLDREAARGFLAHLAALGVLEVALDAGVSLTRWRTAPVRLARDGFLDTFREVESGLGEAVAARLEHQLAQVERIVAAIRADRAPITIAIDRRVMPLLRVFRERLATAGRPAPPRWHWPPPLQAGSPYARLREWIGTASEPLDVGEEDLDRLGLAPAGVGWPTDYHLRVPGPGAGFDAVLEDMMPAGWLDARFIGTLRRLHGEVPHADFYAGFLRQLERETGVTLLELLIPPLSLVAANAVRRPLYTRAWTGDPDIGAYCPDHAGAARYVPLSAIELRATDGHVTAEVDGRPVCAFHHAMRTPLPPWDVLADCLLTAAPPLTRGTRWRLERSLDAFPERRHMPRITVAGRLVVAPAQWRIPNDVGWEANDDRLRRLRGLDRLRGRWAWPRWVFVSADDGGPPAPCDLESIRALAVFEHASRRAHDEIRVVEMLPSPEQLLVVDGEDAEGAGSVSTVMLRVPRHCSAAALAARLAPMFTA